MTESTLINQLISLENSHHFLTLQINLWTDSAEKNELIRQRTDVENLIQETTQNLTTVDDKSLSANSKQLMIQQLRIYSTKIGTHRHPIKLQKIDSVNIENSLFSNLLTHIKAISHGQQFAGIHIPFLAYSYAKENTIAIENLLDFINREIEIIGNIQVPNFILLKEYYTGFENRLLENFIY